MLYEVDFIHCGDGRMSEVFSKWTWIIIASVILIMVIPLIVVWTVLQLPPEIRLIATISIIVLWGVVAGYKDWIIAKRKEEEGMQLQA